MANSFNFAIFRKCWSNIFILESLLLGQAGLLNNTKENPYYTKLQKEYFYLQKKFKLIPINKLEVKFFRLRPNNFPTIRISQLANLYYLHNNLFSKIIENNNLEGFYNLFSVGTSAFWKTHYSFDSVSKKREKKLTKSFIDLLLINTIIPLKFVYLQYIEKLNIEQFFLFVSKITSEKNSIVDMYKKIGITSKNALESQALLELKNEFCSKNKCLNCAIGNNLLRT